MTISIAWSVPNLQSFRIYGERIYSCYLLPEDFLNYTRFTFAPVWNIINLLVIQIIIEDKNLPSKMRGSFLVKLLRFCISSKEEAKMKKKTIYVVITIAAVVILAIGFQAAPKTLAFDLVYLQVFWRVPRKNYCFFYGAWCFFSCAWKKIDFWKFL